MSRKARAMKPGEGTGRETPGLSLRDTMRASGAVAGVLSPWTRRSILVTVLTLLPAPENAEGQLLGGCRCRGVVGAFRDYRANGIAGL